MWLAKKPSRVNWDGFLIIGIYQSIFDTGRLSRSDPPAAAGGSTSGAAVGANENCGVFVIRMVLVYHFFVLFAIRFRLVGIIK